MYHELTVWSRGIIMDKEARDVSSCIAAAARALGFYADNVSDYVDDPDRTNCLVRRYARFGDSPIVDRFVYENPRPGLGRPGRGDDHQGGQLPPRHPGRRRGPGGQLRPRTRVPAEVPARLDAAKLAKLVVVDAVGLAEQRGSSPWMFVRDLGELAYDRMSTEGAEERLAIGMGIAAPLIGALVAATGVLPAGRGGRARSPTATRCSAASPSTGSSSSLTPPPRRPPDPTREPPPAQPAEEAPCPYAAPGSRRTCSCRSPA